MVNAQPSSAARGTPDCISHVKKCFEGKDGLSYANILRSRNKFVDALAIYESVVEKDSENVEAHIGKGICLHMQNMGRPAFESFIEAIRLDPQHACALTHCGILYKEEGRLGEAAEGKQSITLEPGGQFELSGAPLETLYQTRAEVKVVAEEMGIGFLGICFQPKWGLKGIPVMPKTVVKKAHLGIVTALKLSHDSRALLSASFDSSARVTLMNDEKQSGWSLWVILSIILLGLGLALYYVESEGLFHSKLQLFVNKM